MFDDDKKTPFGDTPHAPTPPMPNEEESATKDSVAPPMPGGIAPEDAGDDYMVDFSISEDDFKEIEEGDYPGRLIKLESAKSQAGNPMYVWTYVITKGEHQGEELINRTAITPAAMWKLKETLIALGIQAVNGVYNFQPKDVLNKNVILEVRLQDYEGTSRPNISKVLPVGARNTGL